MFSSIDPTISMEKLQNSPEGQYLDRKSASLAPKELAKHISAFANADGGIIVLGIEDDGRITGLTPVQENSFRQAPADFLQVLPEYQVECVSCNQKADNPKILLFHIRPSSSDLIKFRNGEAYLRYGDASRKLSGEQLLALEYSKGIRRFEERIVEDAVMDDLDPDLIREYKKLLSPSIATEIDILKARGLIKVDGEKIKITVAAVLLFGKNPTQFLPGARFRFLRYEGTETGVGTNINIIKDITIEKPLPRLLEEAKQVLSVQMREFQQLDKDGKFKKIPEYPEFAWLEGVVNAVVHRDYSISGDHIRVSMYDDRIEFSSPGKLPSIVTVDNIKETRFSRNPLIARVLTDFGWVRELNEGVKRIYLDMEAYFLEPPLFSEPGITVKLVLKNNIAMRAVRKLEAIKGVVSEDVWNELDSLEQNIILCVANIKNCTPKVLMELTKKSRNSINIRLKGLVEKGILVDHSSSRRDPTRFYTVGK